MSKMLAKKISNLSVFCAGITNNAAAKEEKGEFEAREHCDSSLQFCHLWGGDRRMGGVHFQVTLSAVGIW